MDAARFGYINKAKYAIPLDGDNGAEKPSASIDRRLTQSTIYETHFLNP